MFDFKKWREDRRLTQDQAADFIGASGSLWGTLEAGDKNPNRARVLVYALGQYDHSKGMFKGLVDKLSPGAIRDFMIERRDKTGLSFKEQSLEAGFGRSTMGNIARDTNKWGRVSRLTKTMVVAYMLECAQKETEANKEPEIEVLESVTVPATETLPERTFTSADVVVEVAGVPVEVTQVDPENFERIEHIMVNGSPMWRLVDVCRAIDYKNPSDAKNLVRSADIEKSMAPDSMGRNVEQWLVNEYGLLRILAKANTPKTEPFERWVFEEVLPSIRKTGSYQQSLKAPTIIDALELQLQAARQLEAQQRQIDALAARVDQLGEGGASADEVVDKLMEIDGLKTELHNLVHDIVHTAKRLPDLHPMKADYSAYKKVWHKAFAAAQPRVSAKSEYRRESQIQPSIDVLRTALAFIQNTTLPELMTETPSQLSLGI